MSIQTWTSIHVFYLHTVRAPSNYFRIENKIAMCQSTYRVNTLHDLDKLA